MLSKLGEYVETNGSSINIEKKYNFQHNGKIDPKKF